MARFNKGILGGFSGTVGSVVGGNWKGIDYMRSKPAVRKNRKSSSKQMEQQEKFATAGRFTRSIHELLMETFAGNARLMTGTNRALSEVVRKAVVGTYPTYDIQYDKVLISRGSLGNAITATATAGSAGMVNFNWVNLETNIGKERPTDQVLLVAYCPDNKRALYRKGNVREAMTDILNLTGFGGLEVHTWLTFVSENGSNIADSLYTGAVTVA